MPRPPLPGYQHQSTTTPPEHHHATPTREGTTTTVVVMAVYSGALDGYNGERWRLRHPSGVVGRRAEHSPGYLGHMTIKDICRQGQKCCSVAMENDHFRNRTDHGYGWESN